MTINVITQCATCEWESGCPIREIELDLNCWIYEEREPASVPALQTVPSFKRGSMTHQITASINEALLAQLQLERSNGIETNWLVNEALEMYLDALDAVRAAKRREENAVYIYDVFLSRWTTRIADILHQEL